MTTETESELAGLLAQFAEEFHQLRTNRHGFGQEKYGKLTFLGNDVIRMMIEELADMCNYAEYQYIKLRLLQLALEEDPRIKNLSDDGKNITIGIEAFRGTGAGWT